VERGAHDAEIAKDELEYVEQVAREATTGCTTVNTLVSKLFDACSYGVLITYQWPWQGRALA
jgi:hypothetical protein